MSLQWTCVATFLYVEIFLCLMLMLPVVSPPRWRQIFRSRMLTAVSSWANVYFMVFIGILCLLLLDSIRDMKKYMGVAVETHDLATNPMAEHVNNMKLFRAQRNFYIAGFALFLFVVLRKLVTMISAQAQLMAESEAARKQAESATAAARAMLDSQQDKKENADEESSKLKEELDSAKSKVTALREELEQSKSDLSAMKKQAEGTNREYDRLLEEHARLEKKVNILSGGDDGSKKDD